MPKLEANPLAVKSGDIKIAPRRIFNRDNFGVPVLPIVTLCVHSKSGIEYYNFPEDFTGNVHIEFHKGGLSKIRKGEDLK